MNNNWDGFQTYVPVNEYNHMIDIYTMCEYKDNYY
jgi:hypothetical protein